MLWEHGTTGAKCKLLLLIQSSHCFLFFASRVIGFHACYTEVLISFCMCLAHTPLLKYFLIAENSKYKLMAEYLCYCCYLFDEKVRACATPSAEANNVVVGQLEELRTVLFHFPLFRVHYFLINPLCGVFIDADVTPETLKYLDKIDDWGGPRPIKDTQSIGSAYDNYLRKSVMNPFRYFHSLDAPLSAIV